MIRRLPIDTVSFAFVLLFSFTTAATAQENRPRRFAGFANEPLLSVLVDEAVQKEIGVAGDQLDKVKKILEKSRLPRPQINPFDLSEEERNKLAAELFAKSQKLAAEGRKEHVLLDGPRGAQGGTPRWIRTGYRRVFDGDRRE